MIPRVGESIDPNRRYTLRPGVYCILNRAGRYLLTEEFDGLPDIQLPGGGIDKGESPLQALYREVMEETGWTIAKPRRVGVFRRFVFMPEYNLWAEKLCSVYVARPCQHIRPPSEPFHGTLWMTADEAIKALGNDGDRMFLQKWAAMRQPE